MVLGVAERHDLIVCFGRIDLLKQNRVLLALGREDNSHCVYFEIIISFNLQTLITAICNQALITIAPQVQLQEWVPT